MRNPESLALGTITTRQMSSPSLAPRRRTSIAAMLFAVSRTIHALRQAL